MESGVNDALAALEGGLVVSVQAPDDSPLRETVHIVAIARAAEAGGAAGIRADGGAHVDGIKAAVRLPVIGLRKRRVPGSAVYITPEITDANEVAAAGADLVAVDATLRRRPGGVAAHHFISALVREISQPVLADVDSIEAGVAAREAGAAAVATTLAGYTAGGPPPAEPDIDLVARLAAELDCPVLAEGRYGSPAAVRAALEAGAFAVVVGTAIADPLALTRRFATVGARKASGAAR
ncbi:MAG: putative N-acetylmannosamine-6-phosphate 2-epimerase [Thermoleophilaceae bacterium]|nr:putative N-acetylmannosamine-6-phosphate 2-epimerase [Thermoleophilaceae bacterium]